MVYLPSYMIVDCSIWLSGYLCIDYLPNQHRSIRKAWQFIQILIQKIRLVKSIQNGGSNLKINHLNQMRKLQESQNDLHDLPVHTPSSTGTSSKFLRLGEWIVFALLIWGTAQIYLRQQRAYTLINEMKIEIEAQRRIISNFEIEIEKHKLNSRSEQTSIQNYLNRISIKTEYLHKIEMEKYHLSKLDYIKSSSKKTWEVKKNEDKAKVSQLLAMNNFRLEHQNVHIQREIDGLLKTEYERLSKEYNFSLPQNSFCVVVATLNNNQNFRNIYNLRSILNQNYTNFKVVIIDDASTDRNLQIISQYLLENPAPQKIHLVQNKKKEGAAFNIYQAGHKYCAPEDILMLVDGDDELLGVNVFKVFNSLYTTKGLQVLYSNFIAHWVQYKQFKQGWSSPYQEYQKKNNAYRNKDTRMYHVRSFKVSTFLKIDEKNLKTNEGEWFMSAYDQAINPQVLELSCGRNDYVDEYFYLYNYGLGNNDMEVDPDLNKRLKTLVQRRPKYECPK